MLIHVGPEELVVVASILLCVQHRNVRILNERVCIGAVIRKDADAHADCNLQIVFLNSVRLTERTQYLVCAESGILCMRYARQQNHEFIAPRTADRIGTSYVSD